MCKEEVRNKIEKINELLIQEETMFNGFLGGNLGLLYYYYHAAKVLNDKVLLEKAETLLYNVFEDINKGSGLLQGPLFSNGAAGFTYAVNHLQKNNYIDFDINIFEDLDEYLFDAALLLFEKDNIDYLHGAMGIFHYFSSRTQTETINGYLNKLCKVFCDKAIINKEGAWFANLGIERLKKTTVDFGLAHGLTGFLLLLINAMKYVDNKDDVEKVICLGIEYILNHELPTDFASGEYSLFPFNFEANATELIRVNRMAWCYGDMSVVLLLYRAGITFGNSRYTEKADKMGLLLLERKSMEATLSTDAHFCHGSAGLAQFYKALYNETYNYSYYRAYEYWIGETISLIEKELLEKKYDKNPTGLLEGWAGIAMVLTDYISTEKLIWAKAFLL
jgi:lantibiotic biosynthesis protein